MPYSPVFHSTSVRPARGTQKSIAASDAFLVPNIFDRLGA